MNIKASLVPNLLDLPADIFLKNVSVDCVILGFNEGTIKVLLNKLKGYDSWMLPGGFVLKDESIDDAANRVLKDRTGLDTIYLNQFYTFGSCERVDFDQNRKILNQQLGDKVEDLDSHWFVQRFISVAYYALVDYTKVTINAVDSQEVAWVPLTEVPALYIDHNEILESALSKVRINMPVTPIGRELLPEKFTITELRIIYETILGKPLDRRNFQKRMLSTGLLVKLDEKVKKFGMKETTLFSFNKENYEKALQEGLWIS